MSTLKNLLLKPFELLIFASGYAVVSWLYLQIVISPALLLAMISVSSFNFFSFDLSKIIVLSMSCIGVVIGIFWAERIRRKYGIINFNGYLLSTPEIEGYRNAKDKLIRVKAQKLST